MQGQRPPGSSTETPTPPTLSGDLRYSGNNQESFTLAHKFQADSRENIFLETGDIFLSVLTEASLIISPVDD